MIKVTTTVIHPWNCDAQGHLNTRHYVGIFDDANHVLLARLTAAEPIASASLGWADVRNEVDYMAELKAMDVVEVFTAVRRIGAKSLTIVAEMRSMNSQKSASRMVAVVARFSLVSRRAVALSSPIINAAREWLETPAVPEH